MKSRLLQFVLIAVSISYPILLVFGDTFAKFAICALIVIWGFKAYFGGREDRLLSIVMAVFFSLSLIFYDSNLKLYYPVIVSLFMLFVFLASLKGEAVITKIARLREKELSLKAIKYTRDVTKIWSGFFIFNACVCTILAFFDDKTYWAIYCGLISYLIMGAIFVVEFMYRILVIKGRRD